MKAEELFRYDAVVIGSFEATALSGEQHEILKNFVDRRGGGLLMLAGRDGLSDGGWGLVPIAQTLPAQLPATDTKSFALTTAKAVLTDYGAESPITRFDDDSTKNIAAWNSLPPFGDLQPLGKLKPGAVVLLNSRADNRESPLLVWQHYGRGATYLLATGSTWRWKMRLPHDDQRHYTFWRQLLHALAGDAPSRLSLTTGDKVFDDQRRVPINAEIRNEKFEPVNDANVALTVTNDDGVTVQQQMTPSGQGDGRYTAKLDAPATGLYRVSMTAKSGNTDLGSMETHFPSQRWRRRAFRRSAESPAASANCGFDGRSLLAPGPARRSAGGDALLQSRYRRATDPRPVEPPRPFPAPPVAEAG